MNRKIKNSGFTLVEMLTTIAIIAVMIGLLIPALSMVQKTAGNVRQKGQFYSIGTALEAFRSDMGDYPESNYSTNTSKANGLPPAGGDGTGYCGAQKLAEAVVGYDGFGFHPSSTFRSDGSDAAGNPVYNVNNLPSRKGPYIELETSNAVKLGNLYPAASFIFNTLAKDTFVLCDKYGLVKNSATAKKTGMPILYFRADTTKSAHIPVPLGSYPWGTGTASGMANPKDAVYNVTDNFPIVRNSAPLETALSHPLMDGTIFYERIKNPNFTSPQRPYRANSFILLSAGIDGLYGTPDDIYNFSEEDK